VPQFLPPQHEPAHVQITQQRADRRALWTTSTFVPISRASTLISVLVRFLDRSFQPHLDPMEHGSIYDPASYRLHKLGMRKTIKVAAEICIYDFSMASVDQLMDVSYGVQCAAVFPIGVLFRLQVGFEYGFEHQNCGHFRGPVADSGYS
jgi:hypothetical protein